jgi:hypothetical protein
MREKLQNIVSAVFSVFTLIAILGGGVVFLMFVLSLVIGGGHTGRVDLVLYNGTSRTVH